MTRLPSAASAYLDEPRTADPMVDGSTRTGVVGYASPDGYGMLKDRSKDLITSVGECISSTDPENALMLHRSVAEANDVGRHARQDNYPQRRQRKRSWHCHRVSPHVYAAG